MVDAGDIADLCYSRFFELAPDARDLFRLKLSDDGQRVTIVTDNEQQIFMSYDGVIAHSEQSAAKMASGTPITHADAAYFVVAPTFRTGAEKYACAVISHERADKPPFPSGGEIIGSS